MSYRVTYAILHATILHQMGLDHRKLTYFHGGLEEKLTGVVAANVIRGIVAWVKAGDLHWAAFDGTMRELRERFYRQTEFGSRKPRVESIAQSARKVPRKKRWPAPRR